MPFEVGTYRGKLKTGVVTTAGTGNEQMALAFDIGEHWNGTSYDLIASAERTVFLSLTDKAMPYTKSKLESLNFNGDFENPQFQADPAGVDLTCTEDTYEGKTRERWDLASWGGGNLEKAGTDKLKRLNARWKASGGKQTKAKAGPPATLAAPGGPPPATPARTSTRDAAWAILVRLWGEKKNQAELTEQWHDAIAERRKPEDTFTAEDWGHVEESFEVPF